jgi:uncharacterized protein
MDGLLRGRRRIRAAGAFREVLNGIPLVDHHAHGILRAHPGSLDEFRGLFSESPDPRQWPHVAHGLTYRRAIAVLAAHLGCEPDERAVYERRLATDPAEYASSFLRATNTELLLVDDGFPSTDVGTTWDELGELAGCRALPVLRLETRGEHAADEVETARERGYFGLKTIAAYRGGLDRISQPVLDALAVNDRHERPLPVQVHTGFGDWDLHLWRSDPSLLKGIVEEFSSTTFVLLHTYPFVRHAGWMASVYGNVYFDLSLTIPHVARPAEALHEALELAPVSKLLYASDAARTPELYLLGATWWRDAVAEVLDGDEQAARMILRENALSVYGPSSEGASSGST